MKRVVLYTCIILTIGLLPLLLGFDSLYGCDFAKQQIPFILETKRMLSSGAPWWSWNTFIGENFIGSYSFYTLTSPFVWFVLLFPQNMLLIGILFVLYLKFVCTSVFAYIYLRRMNFSGELSLLGSLLYSFSSFYICSLYYYHFCEPVMLFPLLLVAIENVISGRRNCYIWLCAISFAIVFINFYFAFSSFLLGFVYFLFRADSEKRLGVGIVLKSIGAVLLGIVIDAFVLLPTLMNSLGTARAAATGLIPSGGSIGMGTAVIGIFDQFIPRLISLFVPSITENGFSDSLFGHIQFTSLHAFISLFGAFGIIYYVVKRRDWLQKLLIVLLVIYLTPLNALFSAGTAADYTRWIYGLILFGILATLYILRDKAFTLRNYIYFYLLPGLCLLMVWIGSSYFITNRWGEAFSISAVRIVEMMLGLANVVCCCIWAYSKNKRILILLASLCCTLNLGMFTYFLRNDSFGFETLNVRGERKISHGRLLNRMDLDGHAKDFSYRTDNINSLLNINLLSNTPGLYTHHSLFNKYLLAFREKVDSLNKSPLFSCNRGGREAISALLSVKEVRDWRQKNYCSNDYKGKLRFSHSQNLYDVYEFDGYIPMGFSYDSFITKDEFDKIIENDKSIDPSLLMLDNLVIEEKNIPEFENYLSKGKIHPKVDLDSLVAERRRISSYCFKGDSKGFSSKIDVPQDRVVFFSVAHDPGFTAYIDGQETEIYDANFGMSAVVVPKGNHEIVFTYFPPGLLLGTIISIVGLGFFIALVFIQSKGHLR